MKNLSKAYYKDYFSDTLFRLRRGEIKADGKNIQDRNKHLLASANRKYLKAAQEIYLSSHLPVNHSFCLDVRYPGLVTGVGISHEAKVEGEFKLGLHLDYTTGLPVIYGSSVKGVLRSAFREENLLDILPILAPNLKNELEPIQRKMQSKPLKAWADAIFGDDDDRDSRSPYERDIFSAGQFEQCVQNPVGVHLGEHFFAVPVGVASFVRLALVFLQDALGRRQTGDALDLDALWRP